MIVPVDGEVDEAQEVTEEDRDERSEIGDRCAMRHAQIEHHDRDDDGEHAVAERLESFFAHDDSRSQPSLSLLPSSSESGGELEVRGLEVRYEMPRLRETLRAAAR